MRLSDATLTAIQEVWTLRPGAGIHHGPASDSSRFLQLVRDLRARVRGRRAEREIREALELVAGGPLPARWIIEEVNDMLRQANERALPTIRIRPWRLRPMEEYM